MNALQRLQAWVEEYRGRQVSINKYNGYQPHDWEVRLSNVDVKPKEDWVECDESVSGNKWATVIGIDDNKIKNPTYVNAENFVLGVKEDLDSTIYLTISRVEELGL